MAFIVMELDVLKVAGFFHTWNWIQCFEIASKMRVFINMLPVTLEVNIIDQVEANQRCKSYQGYIPYCSQRQCDYKRNLADHTSSACSEVVDLKFLPPV
jgi:hypothetical protein